MARNYPALREFVVLRNSASAISSTTADTAKHPTRLANAAKGGFALIIVNALDIASGDETYAITIEGRDTVGTGSYSVLGTLSLSAAAASVAGAYLVALDTIKNELRSNATLGGGTPSLTYSAVVFGENPINLPASGVALS